MDRFDQWMDAKMCAAFDFNERTIHYQIIGALVIAVLSLWLTS